MKQTIIIATLVCVYAYMCAPAQAQEALPIVENATPTLEQVQKENEELKARISELENELLQKSQQLNQAKMESLEYQLFLRRIVATMAQIEQCKELETILNFIKQIKSAILDGMERKQ